MINDKRHYLRIHACTVGDAVFDKDFAKVVDFGSPESSDHTHNALKEACPCYGCRFCFREPVLKEHVVITRFFWAGKIIHRMCE